MLKRRDACPNAPTDRGSNSCACIGRCVERCISARVGWIFGRRIRHKRHLQRLQYR
jgi:hypothetical protein